MDLTKDCSVADVFSGAGGLTHGFILEGFNVNVGIDADEACKYPYEHNNPGAKFIHSKVEDLSGEQISSLFPANKMKIMVGCAPCQPFSAYTRVSGKHKSLNLLYSFSDLIASTNPEIISMENVPRLATFEGGKIFKDFQKRLKNLGYHVSAYPSVFAPDYGIPQRRTRLVLFASKFGKIELLRKSHSPNTYSKVKDWIKDLEPIDAGEQSSKDPLHRAASLSKMNMKRIQASKPGGTWEDWSKSLLAECHKKESGKFYTSVYGRMSWDDLAPTITTQCYGFGNGRFGHPEQNRAISMREAALLQTFPLNYKFAEEPMGHQISVMSRFIGNAVPVVLGRVIAKSIKLHLYQHANDMVITHG